MSVAELVRRLQSRPAVLPQAVPGDAASVRIVAPRANTLFQAVRTSKPAPMLAIRPVFAPVAPFTPESVEVQEKREENAPAGTAALTPEVAQRSAALFDEGRREAFDERAAIMQFDGGPSRLDAEAAARALLADDTALASVVQTCAGCRHIGRRRTCLEPVAAGLLTQAQGFGIVWPSEGHGATCVAFGLRKGLS